jgi:pSer/pThr/pTyr-binding forkhead associated (FHA) protein
LSYPIPIVSTGEPRLVSASGDALSLDEGVLTVGREIGLGLSLINETTVSRNHAEIVRMGTSVKVRDLGSTNGTFVNGVQVTGEVELKPGDQVQFGAVRFRFEG